MVYRNLLKNYRFRGRNCKLLIIVAFVFYSGIYSASGQNPPYPPSPVIKEIALDWSTHRRGAQGSDNFQLTWADDNNLYGAWGDGGGFFGNDNNTCRVRLGVACVKGTGASWTGTDVWGDSVCVENYARFNGKSWGMICVDDTLYMWVVSDHEYEHHNFINLARSFDHGKSWEKSEWIFHHDDRLSIPTFLNFGRNNSGTKDDYVYSYFIHVSDTGKLEFNVQKPGRIYLARNKKNELWINHSYEWFTGTEKNQPTWGSVKEKVPVFEDSEGIGPCMSVFYNPGLQRYILSTNHTEKSRGLLGIFDAPEPWGPWTTAKYWNEEEYFGESRPGDTLSWENNVFFIAFNNKWLSPDGRKFTMNFTGAGRGSNNDSFNTVEGSFIIK